MGRTRSARPRLKCAPWVDQFARSNWANPSVLFATTLFQSVLLIALAIFLTMRADLSAGFMASPLVALGVFSAGVVMFGVFRPQQAETWAKAADEVDLQSPHGDAINLLPSSPVVPNAGLATVQPMTPEHLARLSAQVSHELRTPLNAVIGFSEVMQSELLGPVGNARYREYAGHIRDSAERFARATESALAVNQFLSASRVTQLEALDVSTIVNDCVQDLHEKGEQLHVTSASSLQQELRAEGDRRALQDAIAHALSAANTVKKSRSGIEPVGISVSASDPGGNLVDIVVTVDAPANASHQLRGSNASSGPELDLLLAQLSLDIAGGQLETTDETTSPWQARLRLPKAAQREFDLLH